MCLCILLCSAVGLADELHLKNGDRLTGQIVRMTDDKLVFKSQAVGEVTVNLSDIRTFSSDTLLEIHLKDGTVLHQPVATAEPNGFSITTGKPLQPQTFALTQVASINPPPKPEPKWTGSISGSVASTHGNTNSESLSGSFSTIRRSEKDRLTANADYARTEQEDPDTGDEDVTANWWKTKAQYDYFFSRNSSAL